MLAENLLPTQRRPTLTKRKIDAARYTGQCRNPCIVWDGALSNFGLRIQPTGRKSFVAFYRTSTGQKRLVKLAGYPEATLDEARKRARRLFGAVLDGVDPARARRDARAAPLFRDLAAEYLEKHARLYKRSASDDEQRIRAYLNPAWGTRKAESLRRSDVGALHRKLGERSPYLANRVLKLASAIFTWGERMGILPENHLNPVRGVPTFPEPSRDRWLSRGEVARLFAALEQEPNPFVRGFFVLCLLTGARKNELLGARWKEVDLEAGFLRLPETKAGRPHYVALSSPARAILERLPRETNNPYVFPGHRTGCSLVNVSKPWKRICARAGVEDARLHDLRRTVGSWLAQNGASLLLIGKVLNHSTPSTTQVYAHLEEQNVLAALEAHGEQILEATGLSGRALMAPRDV